MDFRFDQSKYDMYTDAPISTADGSFVPKTEQPVKNEVNDTEQKKNAIREQITAIDKKISELEESLKILSTKYAPKQGSDSDLEYKMAANRARRIKKDDDTLYHWRWQKNREDLDKRSLLNYNWQTDETNTAKDVANQEALFDLDSKVSAAARELRLTREKYNMGMATKYDVEMAEENLKYIQEKRNRFAKQINESERKFTDGELSEEDKKRIKSVQKFQDEIKAFGNSSKPDSVKAKLIEEIDSDENLDDATKRSLKASIPQSIGEMTSIQIANSLAVNAGTNATNKSNAKKNVSKNISSVNSKAKGSERNAAWNTLTAEEQTAIKNAGYKWDEDKEKLVKE